MKGPTIISLVFVTGCSTEHTGSTTSAVNTDPGATRLAFHTPSGIDLEIRSVTPAGQADPIYMRFGGLDGETTGDGSKDVLFQGDILGAKTPEQYAAALAPLTAALLGLTTTDQVQETVGFTYGPIQIQYVQQPPPHDLAVKLVQQAATYAFLKEGPGAGALANFYIASLGIDPCPLGPVVKELGATASLGGNPDPGATTLSFHAPSGLDVDIRSVTPNGQPDPIYMRYSSIDGETTNSKQGDAIFVGDIVGSDGNAADPQLTSAAAAPLTAALLGLATFDQFTATTGLTIKPVQLQPAPVPPSPELAIALVHETASYALFKDGALSGAIADSNIASLGIDPCPTGPVVK